MLNFAALTSRFARGASRTAAFAKVRVPNDHIPPRAGASPRARTIRQMTPMAVIAVVALSGCGRAVTGTVATITTRPSSGVLAARLVAPRVGWALTSSALMLTSSGGASWSSITPPTGEPSAGWSIQFINAETGWIGTSDTNGIGVYRTTDGGESWATTILTPVGPAGPGAVQVDAVDALHVWLAERLPSGSAFSYGALWASNDGGVSWTHEALPTGGMVEFVNQYLGYLLGGPAGTEMYQSHDGGATWVALPVAVPAIPAAGQQPHLPTFSTPEDGILPVTYVDAGGTNRFGAFFTTDRGHTWGGWRSLTDPLLYVGQTSWVGLDPTTNVISSSVDAGQSWTPQGSLSSIANPRFAGFAGERTGWELGTVQPCPNPRTCSPSSSLFQTVDGGATWANITP